MRRLFALAINLVLCGVPGSAQMGRTLDWPTYGGDSQRTGWEKSDANFKLDDVAKGFRLLWKTQPKGRGSGRTLMPPVILGTLIGYRGFKELAFIAGTDDSMQVMDADLDRVYWQRRFEVSSEPAKAGCSGGSTPMPTLMAIGFRRPPPRPAAGKQPGAVQPRPAPNPMFGPRAIYVITSDGKLHRVNVANGEEAVPPVDVLPPHARASTLNMNDNVIYTSTDACGGQPSTVWAIDIGGQGGVPKVTSFDLKSPHAPGLGGPVIGHDGTVYVQAADELLALSPKDVKLKGSFSVSAGVTPVIFTYQERDVIVTGGKDGRLYLFDSQNAGKTAPLSQTGPLGRLWGGLSSWESAEGVRWVLAPVWGPAGKERDGSIAAFKLEEQDGKPVLKRAWMSRAMTRPAPPVIASGVVFALDNGEEAKHVAATLYALNAETGEEIWSSGKQLTAPGALTGLTVANGRVYFATSDNTLWTFGMPLEW